MPPTIRDRHKRMTRELFLASALESFSHKGFAATTIDDIAAGAGTTRTTFYLHFASKTELMRGVLAQLDDHFTSADDPPLRRVIELGERHLIDEWINRKFNQWESAKPMLVAAYQAAPVEAELDEAMQEWFEHTISAMVEGLNRADRFAAAERRIRCVLAFGAFEHLARRWIRVGWGTERELARTMLTGTWCHLLT